MQVDGAPPVEPPPLDVLEPDTAPPELPPLPSSPVASPPSVGPTSLRDVEPPHAAIVSHIGRHASRILGKGGDRWTSVIISVSLPRARGPAPPTAHKFLESEERLTVLWLGRSPVVSPRRVGNPLRELLGLDPARAAVGAAGIRDARRARAAVVGHAADVARHRARTGGPASADPRGIDGAEARAAIHVAAADLTRYAAPLEQRAAHRDALGAAAVGVVHARLAGGPAHGAGGRGRRSHRLRSGGRHRARSAHAVVAAAIDVLGAARSDDRASRTLGALGGAGVGSGDARESTALAGEGARRAGRQASVRLRTGDRRARRLLRHVDRARVVHAGWV